MKPRPKISLHDAIAGVRDEARKKAFRKGLPVAVSEKGRTILIYSNGSRAAYTGQAIRRTRTRNGKA